MELTTTLQGRNSANSFSLLPITPYYPPTSPLPPDTRRRTLPTTRYLPLATRFSPHPSYQPYGYSMDTVWILKGYGIQKSREPGGTTRHHPA